MAKNVTYLFPDGLAAAFAELEETGKALEVYRCHRLVARGRLAGAPTAARLGFVPPKVDEHEHIVEQLITKRMRDADWPPRLASGRIRGRLGALAPQSRLEAVLAELDPRGSLFSQDLPHRLELLLFLAGGYLVEGPWVTGPELRDPSGASILAKVTRNGPVDLAELRLILDRLGVCPELQLPWIEDQPGYRIVDGRLFRFALECDVAALALARHGEPVTPAQLSELIDLPRVGRAAIREILERDRRFRRVAWRAWALAEWGDEPFLDTRTAVCREIERHEGEMDLAALARTLGDRLGIPAAAVRAEAAAGRGIALDHGRVSWRGRDRIFHPPACPLTFVAGCFRLRRGWAFRVDLGHSHLRGAPVPVPGAFAHELGRRGGEGPVLARPGLVELPWRDGGKEGARRLGGLDAAAEACGARRGDLLFLRIHHAGGVDLEVVGRDRREARAGWERLALECGRGPAGGATLEVADALDLAPELPDLGAAIRRRLAGRGESELLSLVPS